MSTQPDLFESLDLEREAREAEERRYGCRHLFSDAEDQTALAGADGRRAAKLLAGAQADGARVFAAACERAVGRLLAAGDPLGAGTLFDDEELADVAEALSRAIATADLLGRTRIRRRAELAEAGRETFAEDGHDPFDVFADEEIPSLAPEAAVGYFQKLVPTLGAAAVRYGPRLDRHAFTLAVASDQVILDRVKAAILRALNTGESGTPAVQEILDAAGVSPANPQYAELVVRTNVMDALNQGAQDELSEPDMRERFPAYQYVGILDGRTGEDHKPKIGKYYPSTVPFAEVRGPRVWNCRCSFAPVSRFLMNGVQVEDKW